MPYKMTECARCKRTVTKKSTKATFIEMGHKLHSRKKFSMRGGHRTPRGYVNAVGKVTRECRDGKACAKYIREQEELAAKVAADQKAAS